MGLFYSNQIVKKTFTAVPKTHIKELVQWWYHTLCHGGTAKVLSVLKKH